MAWGSRKKQRRTSRRDRNLALLGRSILILLLFGSIALLGLSRLAPERFESFRGASADIIAPVWGTLGRPITWFGEAGDYVGDYFNAVDRVRELERREHLYRKRRLQYEQAEAENRELKNLLAVVDPARRRVGAFAIAGSSGGAYLREAVISGGLGDGVRPGQPVISADGLVGRTVSAGRFAARVMLVNDVSSRVPVRVVRTGLPALVIGNNKPLVDVDLTGPTTNIVELGDRLVTSGDGGLFPPGIPVATIVRALGDLPQAQPSALPSGMSYVLVEEPYMPPPDLGGNALEALDAPIDTIPEAPADTPGAPAETAALEGQAGAPAP